MLEVPFVNTIGSIRGGGSNTFVQVPFVNTIGSIRGGGSNTFVQVPFVNTIGSIRGGIEYICPGGFCQYDWFN